MVRVGIIGLGHNGLQHLEAHRRVGKSEIVGICDANPQRLKEAAANYGISRTFTDAAELCAWEGVDAISINTGDPFHAEPFVAAVENGKHVLVEKPVANTRAQIESMVKAAQSADPHLKLAVGYILRFNPVFAAVYEYCRSGRLGQIYNLEGDYIHNLLYQAKQTDTSTGRNWYLEEEEPMVGGGSHPLDLLRWFAGAEVVEVIGYANHVAFPAMRKDDCQVALFKFDNGAIAKVSALYAPRMGMAPYYNLRVYGTLGTVERDNVAVAANEDDVHPAFNPIPCERVKGHAYDPEISDWLDAITENHPPRCSFFDGANSTVATLMALEAIASKTAVKVPVYKARN